MGKIKLLILSFLLLNAAGLSAQTRFNLEKRDGHLYFTAPVRDTPVEIMVESGIPALLVGRGIYDDCLSSSTLSFQPAGQKIRLLNQVYDIVLRAEGTVEIGDALFEGPVFVLEDYAGMAVPIQYLKDPASGRSVLSIDLKDGFLAVGESADGMDGTRYKLSFDKELGFPVVSAEVGLVTAAGRSRLKGGLIVDFGNPSLLFLLKQHKSLAKAVRKKKVVLKDAFDREGRLVAQGIYADTVTLLGREYHGVSIGVTDKMSALGQLGFMGLPFFDSPVVFDFDRGVMSVSE